MQTHSSCVARVRGGDLLWVLLPIFQHTPSIYTYRCCCRRSRPADVSSPRSLQQTQQGTGEAGGNPDAAAGLGLQQPGCGGALISISISISIYSYRAGIWVTRRGWAATNRKARLRQRGQCSRNDHDGGGRGSGGSWRDRLGCRSGSWDGWWWRCCYWWCSRGVGEAQYGHQVRHLGGAAAQQGGAGGEAGTGEGDG